MVSSRRAARRIRIARRGAFARIPPLRHTISFRPGARRSTRVPFAADRAAPDARRAASAPAVRSARAARAGHARRTRSARQARPACPDPAARARPISSVGRRPIALRRIRPCIARARSPAIARPVRHAPPGPARPLAMATATAVLDRRALQASVARARRMASAGLAGAPPARAGPAPVRRRRTVNQGWAARTAIALYAGPTTIAPEGCAGRAYAARARLSPTATR